MPFHQNIGAILDERYIEGEEGGKWANEWKCNKREGTLMKEHKIVNQCLAAGFSLEALMETLRQRPSAKQPQKSLSHYE